MYEHLTWPIYINSDYGRIGLIAWNNKTNDDMANLLGCAWGNIYWCRWSYWHQEFIPHKVSLVIKDETEKLRNKVSRLIQFNTPQQRI